MKKKKSLWEIILFLITDMFTFDHYLAWNICNASNDVVDGETRLPKSNLFILDLKTPKCVPLFMLQLNNLTGSSLVIYNGYSIFRQCDTYFTVWKFYHQYSGDRIFSFNQLQNNQDKKKYVFMTAKV